MNGRWMTCKFISFLFMQDTVYCFHLLAGRQKRSLLYALCSALLVAAVWLLHPEWPFWAGYIAWALAYAATLIVQHTIPSAARTAETPGFILLRKLRKNKEGRIQASCWNAGVAVPPFTRTPICPGREKLSAGAPLARKNGKKNLPVNKPGPLPPERNAGRKGLSSTEEKSNGLFWKPSRNSSCAGLRGWWGARW